MGLDLNGKGVFRFGRALGAYFRGQGKVRIVVGRDCRESSPEWRERLVEALLVSSCRVIDIGVVPPPVLYFGIRHLQAEGGVIITASHNPPEFNGFKICDGYHAIFGEEIQKLYRLALKGEFISGKGTVEHQDIFSAYLDHLSQNLRITKPLRLGLDAGHGTTGPVALPLFQRLGCEV